MNKKVIEALARKLNLNVEELTQALTTEDEVTFEIPENLKVITSEQLEQLKDNHGKSRYDAGAIAGREMLLKDMSKEAGFETLKDSSEFLSKFKSSILEEAKAEPNEKITTLENSLKTLQSTVQEKDGMIEQLKSQMAKEKRLLTIQSAIPQLPENLNLTKDEATALYMQGREFKEDGIYLNGKRLEDDIANPVDVVSDVQKWVESKGWNKPEPKGRGGGAQGGKGGSTLPKTMEDYEALVKSKGYNTGSQEALALLQEAAKKHPEILEES